jgi:hypothetical protein
MKKIIAFAVILISLLCSSCEKCVHQYEATDPRISSCFFKVGSYFIYSDTTDHIIDSQYVFLYSYQPNSVVLGNECSTYANEYILNKDRITNKFDWENRTYLSTKS